MRIRILVVVSLFLCAVQGSSFGYDRDLIEIDLVKKKAQLVDFYLGSFKVNGDLAFDLEQDSGSLILEVKAGKITFSDKIIPWVVAKLKINGKVVDVSYICLPRLIAKGKVDLSRNKLDFVLEGSWEENSSFLEGEVKIKIKAWGSIDSFLTSGYLVVDGGRYKGKDFTHLRIDFLGKLPLLNITDSQLVLESGNVVEIKGVLDLRDFSNILPGAEYSPQKIFIDKWQLFSLDNESIGLKKQIDDKLGILVDTGGTEDSNVPQAELRYNWKDDKFLRLDMEDEGTTLKFERRRDF